MALFALTLAAWQLSGWALRVVRCMPRRLMQSFMTLAVVGCMPGCRPVDSRDHAVDGSADAPTMTEVVSSLGDVLVLLPGGTFTMGNERGLADERPPHEVTVNPFAMDKFEVTQQMFARIEWPNPSHFKGADRPVEQIRWSDAAIYCNERSRAEGLEPCYDEVTFACDFQASGYRLPTEAEWEYAARAGETEVAPANDAPRELDRYACYAGTSRKQTDRVGQRRPNAWGLHDMLGNVSEWCHDIYDPRYYERSESVDPRGPNEGTKRVLRGGAWKSPPQACRPTARLADDPGINDACFVRDTYGFRCVRRLSDVESSQLSGPLEPSAEPPAAETP